MIASESALALTTPKLRLDGLVKEYPGTRVVDDVSFEIRAGEIHALIGENGAGKSTIIKMVSGALSLNGGAVYLDGVEQSHNSVRDAQAAGIAVVPQELNLVGFFDAAENVFLGMPYPKMRVGLTDFTELRSRAKQVFDSLGTDIPLNVPVRELTPALQTMVSIARALVWNSQILILDEPTAALTDTETSHLFQVLRLLRERGTAILYVSHRLEEILTLSDRVTVLRDGRHVATISTADATMNSLITMMIGRTVDQMYPERIGEISAPVLEVDGLAGEGVDQASFVVHRGEILGIGGLAGSGRSEVLSLVMGAARRSSGTMKLDGQDFSPHSPTKAIAAGVVLVPEERRSMGLVLIDSIRENLTLANLTDIAWRGFWVKSRQDKALAQDLVGKLRIKTIGIEQQVRELSGGNQQKVVFGKCLAGKVKVLLLDEPTRGVDVGSKQEIYEIIRGVARDGTAVILVSSDLPELLGLSDRIVIMANGNQCDVLQAKDLADEAELLNHCYRGAER